MRALCLCFQNKPGTRVPAGLQGGLQNPVSGEEGKMNGVCHEEKSPSRQHYKETYITEMR